MVRGHENDFVIPKGKQGEDEEPTIEGLDDFVIGEDLLKMVGASKVESAGRDIRLEGMLLVQHVEPVEEEFPLALSLPRHLLFKDLNAKVSEGTPLELWRQQEIRQHQWHELTSEMVTVEEEGALEEFFDSYRIFYEALVKLNQRVVVDCRKILEKDERMLDPLDPENAISKFEMDTLRKRVLLDRDLIEEQSIRLQGWLNQAILVGDLEQMQQLKDLNHDLYATRALLRQVALRFELEDQGAAPASAGLEVREEKVVDVPEIAPVRFSEPIRARRKKEAPAAESAEERPESAEDLLAKAETIAARRSQLLRYGLLLVLFLMIPLSYRASKLMTAPQATAIDAGPLRVSIPMLRTAHDQQGRLIGRVDQAWAELSQTERRRQAAALYAYLQDEEYQIILLYYPNGTPAANIIGGQVTLY